MEAVPLELTDDVTFVDNTLLSTLECTTRAVLRHVLHYTARAERATLKSGQAGHEALALWFKGFSKDQCLIKFETEYASWATENVPPDDRLSYSNCRLILDNWFDTHPREGFPFTIDPLNVERTLMTPLDDNGEFMFVFKQDLLTRDRRTGDYFVVDHKFTGSYVTGGEFAKKFRLDSQQTGYIWGARQLHPDVNVTGSYINAIELRKVPTSDRKCNEHGQKYAECGVMHVKSQLIGPIVRTDAQLQTWRRDAIGQAKKFRDLCDQYPHLKMLALAPMEGTFFNACGYCEFMDFCATGRPIKFAESMLVQDPWQPWTEATVNETEAQNGNRSES